MPRNNLIPVKRMVTRGGKTYETTVYVSPKQAEQMKHKKKQEEPKGSEPKTKTINVDTSEWEKMSKEDDLKQVLAQIKAIKDPAEKEVFRNEIVDFMERSGVEWEKHEDKAINYMRCMMKVKRDMKVGYFTPEGRGKHKETPFKRVSKADARLLIDHMKRNYSKEMIREYAENSSKIQWKRSEHEGIDHMRMMMAIRESLEDGTGFKLVGGLVNPNYRAQAIRLNLLNQIEDIITKDINNLYDGWDVELDEGNETLTVKRENMEILVKYPPRAHKSFRLIVKQEGAKEREIKSKHTDIMQKLYENIYSRHIPKEVNKEHAKKLAKAKTIHNGGSGLQLNGLDPKAVLERSKETGETLYVAKSYEGDMHWEVLDRSSEDYAETRKFILDEYIRHMTHRPLPFNNHDDIQKWADKMGIEVTQHCMDLTPPEAWVDIKPVVEEMFENFPRLREVHIGNGKTKKFKIDAYGYGEKGGKYNNTYMCANNFGIWVCPASLIWEDCLRSMTHAMDKHFFELGDGTFKTLVRHEFGHVLQYSTFYREGELEGSTSEANNGQFVGTNPAKFSQMKEELEAISDRSKDKTIYSTSPYKPKSKHAETMAEAFTALTSTMGTKKSDKPDYVNEIEEFLVRWNLLGN